MSAAFFYCNVLIRRSSIRRGIYQMIGVPIGVLIGTITGLVVMLMIRTAWQRILGIGDLLKITGEFLVVPTFWFGGPWLSGKLLASSDPSGFLSEYLVTL